jgi:hypothetical protein
LKQLDLPSEEDKEIRRLRRVIASMEKEKARQIYTLQQKYEGLLIKYNALEREFNLLKNKKYE